MARTRIRHRRGPAHIWAEKNPILADGEIGIETDTSKIKCGDGVRTWNELPYLRGTGTEAEGSEVDWSNIVGLIADNEALKTALDNKQSRSQKGKANGYAPLDAEGMIPAPHLGNVQTYLSTGLTVLAAYDGLYTFDLTGPLTAIEGKLAVGDKVKIAGKVAKITAIAEQTDASEGEEPLVYVTLDKVVLSAADAGVEIGKAVAMVTVKAIGDALASLLTPQIFNKPGTYEVVVPDGVNTMRVKKAAAAGGGGAGGAGEANVRGLPGPGGGAGDSILNFEIPVKPGDVVTIVIGTGGLGGKAGSVTSPGGPGTNGGNTVVSVNGVVALTLNGGKATSGPYMQGGYPGGPNAQAGSPSCNWLNNYRGGDGGDNLIGIGGNGGMEVADAALRNGSKGKNGGGGGGGIGNAVHSGNITNGGDGGDGYLEFVWEAAA